VNSNILLYQSHRDSSDLLRSDTAELRDLLYQILSSQQEMRNVAEMQSAGEHVAEPIMLAGQLVTFSFSLSHVPTQVARLCSL